jgi:hypothetical protein
MDLTLRNQIADWLERNGLTEPIVQARGADASAILRQKMDFILVDAADRLGIEVGDARRTELRKVAYKLGTSLPQEFLGLADLLRWVEAGGPWPKITSRASGVFLHPARQGGAGPRSGEHALVRAVADGRAADVHRPQGAVLRAVQDLVATARRPMWRISWRGSIRWTGRARGPRSSGRSRRWTSCTARRWPRGRSRRAAGRGPVVGPGEGDARWVGCGLRSSCMSG